MAPHNFFELIFEMLPWRNDATDADANFRSFEEFLAEIDAVPEGLEIFLDLKDF